MPPSMSNSTPVDGTPTLPAESDKAGEKNASGKDEVAAERTKITFAERVGAACWSRRIEASTVNEHFGEYERWRFIQPEKTNSML
jgi:hypothetical protein